MELKLIKQKVNDVILEILSEENQATISEESNIFDMGFDSINAATLVEKLQELFGIELEVSDINFENFQNIHSIAQFIKTKIE